MMSFSQPVCLSFFLIAVYLKVCVCQTINCTNCCSNATYTEINEPRRSIKSFWQQGQPYLCDRGLRSGWYRFISDAGGKVMMPETSVPEYHCGTHDPIWLNGSHPTVAEGNVVRQGCISSFGVVCDDTIDINVTNCGDYYVYYLRPTFYCAVAYCAGEKYTMLIIFSSFDICNKHWNSFAVGMKVIRSALFLYAFSYRSKFSLNRWYDTMSLRKGRCAPKLFWWVLVVIYDKNLLHRDMHVWHVARQTDNILFSFPYQIN